MAQLDGRKIAMVVDDYFEQAELTGPKQALEEAGAQVDIISTNGNKKLQGLNHVAKGKMFKPDAIIDTANAADYDAVVLPGGAVNADKVRAVDKAREFVREMFDAGKPVAAICHAPWLLVSSGIARGHKLLTSYYTLQDDVRNAGGEWVDEEVVVDQNLITSRYPPDVPAFSKAIIDALAS